MLRHDGERSFDFVSRSVLDQLRDCARQLPAEQQRQVLDFAAFLLSRQEPDKTATVPTTPLDIPRPPDETVLQAVKRLRAGYPMLDQAILLHPVSALVTGHVLKGQAASDAIDELENVFRESYQHWLQGK